MDEQSRNAILLLDAFNSNKERLRHFAYEMLKRHRSDLKTANSSHWLTGHKCIYSEEFNGEMMFVATAIFATKRCVEWVATLYWNASHWLIETEIYIDSENERSEGMETVKKFPVRWATTLEECISSLDEAVSDLINTGDALDVLAIFEKSKK